MNNNIILFMAILLMFIGILTALTARWQLADKYKQALIQHQIGYYDQTTGVFTIKDSK